VTLHVVHTRLAVSWTDLLEAYQWYVAYDESTAPCLDLTSGRVTCPTLLGLSSAAEAPDRLAPMPLKGPDLAYEQRLRFTESVCDDGLRRALAAALSGPRAFKAFDEALFDVPIEETRWAEEERITDLQRLDAWLGRLGIDPDPPPNLTRTVIAFPRLRG
jgi:hypothetical protein